MDILTHALSGIAIATCVAAYAPTSILRKSKVLISGALGGILPDIDAISHWSRFDSIFGQLFLLPHSGKEIYSGKFWYSHHAFFHSLLGSIVFGILFVLAIYLFRKISSSKKLAFVDFCKSHTIYFIAFVFGFWAHLLGDIITPGASWGGVALFYPSTHYVGGLGNVWWWNNYDLFLLIVCCITLNIIVLLFSNYLKKHVKKLTSIILFSTFILILIQINTRKYNYAYTGSTSKFAEMEQNSKKEQERILNAKIYLWMERFDKRLPILF